jgi:hypothetical protein
MEEDMKTLVSAFEKQKTDYQDKMNVVRNLFQQPNADLSLNS